MSSHATLNNRHIYSESPEHNWPYCAEYCKNPTIAGVLDGKRHVMALTINKINAPPKRMNNAHARCLLQCTRNRRQHNGFSNNGFNKNHGQQQLKSTSNRKSKQPLPIQAVPASTNKVSRNGCHAQKPHYSTGHPEVLAAHHCASHMTTLDVTPPSAFIAHQIPHKLMHQAQMQVLGLTPNPL
ncbi:hypothetical protein O4444_01025 [Xylella fastidiosa subsp. pauca]|uniref:hypothetical protein n=1 Tax=Xylella fastidiosa TaxID=2371 RepID=UPI00249E724D|nr:hypothetical protein [Xylella fastidiosa]WGZ32261.1 hypothetical protein O4444_01025 [Xylella fastidiosa subsp. pauca]